MNKTPHIFIAPPAYRVHPNFAPALALEVLDLFKSGINVSFPKDLIQDFSLPRARNRYVATAMLAGASHILCWDPDVRPDKPGAAKQLLLKNLDIVGGIYAIKDDSGKINAQWDDGPLPKRNDCIEISRTGTGFLLISMEVFEGLKKIVPSYCSNLPLDNKRTEWDFFGFEIKNNEYLSDDWAFCDRVKEIGFKIHVDPTLSFDHFGERSYRGNMIFK